MLSAPCNNEKREMALQRFAIDLQVCMCGFWDDTGKCVALCLCEWGVGWVVWGVGVGVGGEEGFATSFSILILPSINQSITRNSSRLIAIASVPRCTKSTTRPSKRFTPQEPGPVMAPMAKQTYTRVGTAAQEWLLKDQLT